MDSSILILVSRAEETEIAKRAVAELDKDGVEYLYSPIVELEVIPRPTVNKRTRQVQMLRAFFDAAEEIPCNKKAQKVAFDEACKGVGLDAADALHVGCAVIGFANELICAESPDSTLPKCKALPIRTIHV